MKERVCKDNIPFKNTPTPSLMDYDAQPSIMEEYFATVLMCYQWLTTHTKWTFVGGFLVLRTTTLRNDYNGYREK